MAYTLRNVSQIAHSPLKQKVLTGETRKGINGEHRKEMKHCSNCKCNRYHECYCTKPTPGSKSQRRKANRLANNGAKKAA